MSSYRRTTWREREVQAERERKEFAARAAEEARAKTMAKTETNFPSTMRTTTAPTSTMPPGKFAELAMKWQIDEEIMLRHARSDRERKVIRDTVMFLRSHGASERPSFHEDEEEEESWVMPEETLEERFPAHGKRGSCTAPDGDGWRLVTRKARKQPRALTEAELARRYREAFVAGEAPDEDVNGDLAERSQRREFY